MCGDRCRFRKVYNSPVPSNLTNLTTGNFHPNRLTKYKNRLHKYILKSTQKPTKSYDLWNIYLDNIFEYGFKFSAKLNETFNGTYYINKKLQLS